MKKILLLGFLLPFMIWSCQTDDARTQNGKGTITISNAKNIVLDTNVFTRAEADVQLFTLNVIDEATQAVVASGLLSEFPGGVVEDLPAGTYTVALTSHPDGFTPAFEDAMYEAKKTGIDVAPNSNNLIELEATQSNAGVYFVYHESLNSVFSDVVPTITQGSEALVYQDANREAKGYFHPQDAILTIKDGNDPVTISGEDFQTLRLDSEQLWEITLKVEGTDPNGSVTIQATVKMITDPTHFEEFVLNKGGQDPVTPDNDGYLTVALSEVTMTTANIYAITDLNKAPNGIDFLSYGYFEGQFINDWLQQGRTLNELMESGNENIVDLTSPLMLLFINSFGADFEMEDLEPGSDHWVIFYSGLNGDKMINFVNFTTRITNEADLREGEYTWNWYFDFDDDLTNYSQPEPKTLKLSWLTMDRYLLKEFWGVSTINMVAIYDEEASTLTLTGYSDRGGLYVNSPEGLTVTEEDDTKRSGGFYVWDDNKNLVDNIVFDIENGEIVASRYNVTLDVYVLGSIGLPRDFLYHYSLAPSYDPLTGYTPGYVPSAAGTHKVSAKGMEEEPYKIRISAKDFK